MGVLAPYFPAGHAAQDVAPVLAVSISLPAAQSEQLASPADAAYLPAEQITHDVVDHA